MEVHGQLGNGFVEYIYQDALEIEFINRKIDYVREVNLTVKYKGETLKHTYVADFCCYNEIIVETKAVKALLPEHEAQILNYLKATGKRVGLLLNFGEPSLVYKRFIL